MRTMHHLTIRFTRRVQAMLLPFAVIAFLILGVACSSSVDNASEGSAGGTEEINWENPFGGTEINDPSEAVGVVNFDPLVPQGLNSLTHTYLVTGGEEADPRLVLVYDDPKLGEFIVDESTAQTDQAGLEKLLDCSVDNGCEGTREAPKLSDGTVGVIVAGPASTGLFWLHDGILIDVYGPPETFESDDAIAVAEMILDGLEQG